MALPYRTKIDFAMARQALSNSKRVVRITTLEKIGGLEYGSRHAIFNAFEAIEDRHLDQRGKVEYKG